VDSPSATRSKGQAACHFQQEEHNRAKSKTMKSKTPKQKKKSKPAVHLKDIQPKQDPSGGADKKKGSDQQTYMTYTMSDILVSG
jgi:hypothetical protein